jgi:hypothetical protein
VHDDDVCNASLSVRGCLYKITEIYTRQLYTTRMDDERGAMGSLPMLDGNNLLKRRGMDDGGATASLVGHLRARRTASSEVRGL